MGTFFNVAKPLADGSIEMVGYKEVEGGLMGLRWDGGLEFIPNKARCSN